MKAAMFEALEGASSLQLYRLKATIEGMLSDPRQGMAARASLHLGQAVRFGEHRDGQLHSGEGIAFGNNLASVIDDVRNGGGRFPAWRRSPAPTEDDLAQRP